MQLAFPRSGHVPADAIITWQEQSLLLLYSGTSTISSQERLRHVENHAHNFPWPQHTDTHMNEPGSALLYTCPALDEIQLHVDGGNSYFTAVLTANNCCGILPLALSLEREPLHKHQAQNQAYTDGQTSHLVASSMTSVSPDPRLRFDLSAPLL